MRDELDDPTPREESGSLEAGLLAGPAADDNSFQARRPSARNDEEGSIENTTKISDAAVDEEEEDEDEDEEEDLATDEDEDEDDDDDDDDEEEEE